MVMYAGLHMGRPAMRTKYSFMNSAARLLGNTTATRDRLSPYLLIMSRATYSRNVFIYILGVISLEVIGVKGVTAPLVTQGHSLYFITVDKP